MARQIDAKRLAIYLDTNLSLNECDDVFGLDSGALHQEFRDDASMLGSQLRLAAWRRANAVQQVVGSQRLGCPNSAVRYARERCDKRRRKPHTAVRQHVGQQAQKSRQAAKHGACLQGSEYDPLLPFIKLAKRYAALFLPGLESLRSSRGTLHGCFRYSHIQHRSQNARRAKKNRKTKMLLDALEHPDSGVLTWRTDGTCWFPT